LRPIGISIPVRIAVDVPVAVDIDVHISAAPIAMAPCRSPCHSPGEADAKRNYRCRIRIIGIPRIINGGWIAGDVNDGWICGCDLNDLSGYVDDLCHIGFQYDNIRDSDDLLRTRFEISCLLSLGPEILDGIHHLFRLINESLAEVNRPGQVRVHFGDQFRELGNPLHIFVPWLVGYFGNIVSVPDEPRSLHDFERIS
jgi:hypothetical protein